MAFRPTIPGLDYYEGATFDAVVWWMDEGIPSDLIGVDGDFYINVLNWDLYQKVGGTWL